LPHNRLQFQGGVIEQDTPVINQAGIAVSNRIRFKYDPLGLSLPEKLGGWAKFYASAITTGVIRALWGWQDTSDNKWLAYGTDGTTGTTQLAAIECTTSNTTGLTTATGTLMDITPTSLASVVPPQFAILAGNLSQTNVIDNSLAGKLPNTFAVYFTTPISVGGVVLQGLYNTQPLLGRPLFLTKWK